MRTKLLNSEGSNSIWPGSTEMARMSEPLDPKVPQMACRAAPCLPFSASDFERYVVFKTGRSDWTSSLGASREGYTPANDPVEIGWTDLEALRVSDGITLSGSSVIGKCGDPNSSGNNSDMVSKLSASNVDFEYG